MGVVRSHGSLDLSMSSINLRQSQVVHVYNMSIGEEGAVPHAINATLNRNIKVRSRR